VINIDISKMKELVCNTYFKLARIKGEH